MPQRTSWLAIARPSIVFGTSATSRIIRNANCLVRLNSSAVTAHNLQSEICNLQSLLDCPLPQRVIAKNERGHCFNDRHGSWKNTRIVASAGGKRSLLV